MSKIIMFGNQKGGVGKTTLTCLCANAMSAKPFAENVSVVDADKQQSIVKRRLADLQYFDGETPYQVLQMTLGDFQNKNRGIYKLVQDHEYVFVDVAGKLDTNMSVEEQEITKYLQYVHYLFIPFVPGNYSLESTTDYLKTVLKLKAKRDKAGRPLEIIGFVNMSEAQTLDDRFLLEELEELKIMVNIRWMEAPLSRYALFRNADTLTSFYSKQSKDRAVINFTKWFDEFNKIISE
ncbi:MAG: ParA family protein [Lewinellaceae bacterium]|nr:ParA family protein [Saprospiraceae bacterium]MCB9341674.1 ParA family protein [Lewinellaceae bacterium]